MPPPYRTIYLICHARSRTGGPEAVHQLGRGLLAFGHDARIVYIERGTVPEATNGVIRFPVIEQPMPPEYSHYSVPREHSSWRTMSRTPWCFPNSNPGSPGSSAA